MRQQAAALRKLAARRTKLPIDAGNLAEEVEGLGKNERDTVRSEGRRITELLLKLEFSPTAQPRAGWQRLLSAARFELRRKMTATLRRDAEAWLPDRYQETRYP